MHPEHLKLIERTHPGFSSGKCSTCIFSSSIPGDAHLQCSKKTAVVEVNPTGIAGGYAMWPMNFDPIWINVCDSFVDPDEVFSNDVTTVMQRAVSVIGYKKSIAELYQNSDQMVDYTLMTTLEKALQLIKRVSESFDRHIEAYKKPPHETTIEEAHAALADALRI